MDGRVEGGRHVGRLEPVEGQVDARGDEPQGGPAVFRPVIAPVHVPFGVALGGGDVSDGAFHGPASGLGEQGGRGEQEPGRGQGEATGTNCGTTEAHAAAKVARWAGEGGDVGSMETQRQGLGRWGEEVALGHVVRRGWEVLARNWRIGRLEVDLIARDGPWLVIIEIKTRTEPVQADWHRMVSRAQQDRLIRAARAFLARHPERSLEVRFDVVAVLRNRYGHRILHTESAFYPLLPGR